MRHDDPASSPTKRRHPLSCTVKFKRLLEEAQLPDYKSENAAGMDMYACLPDGPRKVGIPPGDTILIPCGFAMELEPGFEAQVRPAERMVLGGVLLVLPTVSEGEVKVMLMNLSKVTFVVSHGDIIAAMAIMAMPRVEISR